MLLLETKNLNKTFKFKNFSIQAVEDFEIQITPNEFFAIVGESGSGKSTVMKLLARLIKPDKGEIFFKNKNIYTSSTEELKAFRKSIGVVFQDPYASLNPRMRIKSIVEEPLKIHKIKDKDKKEEKTINLFRELGLDEDLLNRYPHQLSGGQRQRVAIARALILEPEILLADEPLSSLDISLQASILNQLIEIKEKRSFAIILITHDLNVVRAVSNIIGVMHLGRIVELAKTKEIFKEPLHPYTTILLKSIPGFHRRDREKKTTIFSEEKNSWLLKGCRFYYRCKYRMDMCIENIPPLKDIGGRKVRCFLY
ncbi:MULTISPECIES: ABC transporter ATP-binding protein [Thermodesulfovibrio]|uniref:ABC transporter ATP-binding protein n=1 Tax=Thermodesulfovibrio TaxID=28261 RepID=UPI00261FDBA1|nr:ABC transporter ATP-binding protein [Thermodesulfovibrio sp.]